MDERPRYGSEEEVTVRALEAAGRTDEAAQEWAQLAAARPAGPRRADALVAQAGHTKEPQAAAVAVPGWDTTWSTAPPPSRLPSTVESGRPPRLVVARSRSRFDGGRLQQALGAEVYAVGSAGVKAMSVVRGEMDAYVHGGGLYEWDSCAPVGVARAAGLACCRLDGSPLEFNKPDPWSPGLIIARSGLVDDLVAVMGDHQI